MTVKKHFFNFAFINTRGQHAAAIVGFDDESINIKRIDEARTIAYGAPELPSEAFTSVSVLLNVSYLGYMSDALMQGEIDADPVEEDLGDLEWTIPTAWEAMRMSLLEAFPTLTTLSITRDQLLDDIFEQGDGIDEAMEIFTESLFEATEVELTWVDGENDDFAELNTVGDLFDVILDDLGLTAADDDLDAELEKLDKETASTLSELDAELAALDETDVHTNQQKDSISSNDSDNSSSDASN